MQRVALINGENINQDYDLLKIFQALATSGVAEGLEVQNGLVTPGFAFVNVTRDDITFPVLFHNTSNLTIDTTGTKKVFIELDQLKIDDGSLNSSNGTGIGEIKIGSNYPSNNFLKLASIDSGNITDERKFIKFKPNPFNLIKLEKNGIYPQWCKIGRLRIPDCSRFKIDLIGGVGYGNYGYENGGSLVRIIGGAATGIFTIGGNWTENNSISGISEVRFIEVTDSEFDLYLYFENGSNPYGELLMKFDGGENSEFIKDFSVSTPTGGIVFSKITTSTDILGLSEKTSIVGNDFFIISDSENGGINKKVKQNNVFKSYFGYFGDGSDGNATITTTITLTKDMCYNNLTINSPGVLNTNGYKVFVMGTLSGNGIIRRNGNNGNNGASPGTGGTGGAILNQGTLGLCYAGINGADGINSVTNGISTNGNTILDTYKNGNNGKGGDGGNTSQPRSGGTGGQNTLSIGFLYNKSILENSKFIGLGFTSKTLYNTIGGGVGGGSGGGGSNGTSGGGGGGGGSGGIILIMANIITFTGTIEAKGGNGGNAGNSTSTSNYSSVTGGSGGGGGGSGSILLLIGNIITLTGSTIDLRGGSGGNGSAGVRSSGSSYASGGTGGNGGDGGFVIIESPSYTAGTILLTGGTGGTGGNDVNGTPASSGITGATGSTIIL